MNRRQFLSSTTALAALLASEKAGAYPNPGVLPAIQKNLQIGTVSSNGIGMNMFVNAFANATPLKPVYFSAGEDGYTFLRADGYPTGRGTGGQGSFSALIPIYYCHAPGGTLDAWVFEWTGAGSIDLGTGWFEYPGLIATKSGSGSGFTYTVDFDPGTGPWTRNTAYIPGPGGYLAMSNCTRGGKNYWCNVGSGAPAYLTGGNPGLTLAALQALTPGTINISFNGNSITSGMIDFSGATSFTKAATIIQAAFLSALQASPIASCAGGVFGNAVGQLTVDASSAGTWTQGQALYFVGSPSTDPYGNPICILQQISGKAGGAGNYQVTGGTRNYPFVTGPFEIKAGYIPLVSWDGTRFVFKLGQNSGAGSSSSITYGTTTALMTSLALTAATGAVATPGVDSIDPLVDDARYFWWPMEEGFAASNAVIGLAGPVANVKVYRQSYGRPATNDILDPGWLANYKPVTGVFRGSNGISVQITDWANEPNQNSCSQVGGEFNSTFYAGTLPAPTKNAWVGPIAPYQNATFPYTGGTTYGPSGPSAWVDKMLVNALVPAASLPSLINLATPGISNGSVCAVTTATAHGLSNGDVVYFPYGIASNLTGVTLADYSPGTTYAVGQVARYPATTGIPYMSVSNGNTGNAPVSDNGTNWVQIGYHSDLSDYLLQSCLTSFRLRFFKVWDVTSTTFTLQVNGGPFDGTYVDTTHWPKWSSGGYTVPQITFQCGNLPPVPVISTSTALLPVNFLPGIQNGQPFLWTFIYDADTGFLLSNYYLKDQSFSTATKVSICNQMNCDPWFVIPAMADDDYVAQMATVIKNNLSPGLVAYFELTCEVWNGNWDETGYAGYKAALFFQNGTWTGPCVDYKTHGYSNFSFFWYGWRFYHVMSIIKSVFAGQTNRVNCVMAEWTVHGSGPIGITQSSYGQTIQGRHLATGCGTAAPPISVADSIAIAPYLNINNYYSGSRYGDNHPIIAAADVWGYCYGNPMQKAMALAKLYAAWTTTNSYQQFDVASLYGFANPQGCFATWAYNCSHTGYNDGIYTVKLVQYEGGLDEYPASSICSDQNRTLPYSAVYSGVRLSLGDLQRFLYGFYQSDYARQILAASLNSFRSHGGKVASQYTFYAYGSWQEPQYYGVCGAGQTVFSTMPPQYTAMKNFNQTGSA